ncbi:hypothetical protein CKO51_22515 [Rhodopirellula sp. SM50]|nr:hypothetical protein CKO51_22515 [Rhodopirellula sp. SM50]
MVSDLHPRAIHARFGPRWQRRLAKTVVAGRLVLRASALVLSDSAQMRTLSGHCKADGSLFGLVSMRFRCF